MITLSTDIKLYNQGLASVDVAIADLLAEEITKGLVTANAKIWHGHPVWFLDGNPIVGYSKEKKGMRLLFWSGASFDEEQLIYRGSKFKDASIFYTDKDAIDTVLLQCWLRKSIDIQWDYKNIVKRKGVLERLK